MERRKKASLDWPTPEFGGGTKGGKRGKKDGKTAMRSFLGITGFFRKFIEGYAQIAAPF